MIIPNQLYQSGDNRIQIDISQLKSGFYNLNILTDGKVINNKIIIE